MNFAQMLGASVTPLKDVVPTRQSEGRGRRNNDTSIANAVNHARTVERYRAVMGDEWVPTPLIEQRMGLVRNGGSGTLIAWAEKGLVERRKIGGDADWCLSKGFEWRFVPEGK